MTIISTPRICSAARQPNSVVSQYASSGTIVPPTPMPRYAKPIALPRLRSNHRDKQHLVGQRAAADVAERVEQVAEIEEAHRRDRAQADQRGAGDQDADQHQSPRSEPVDDPAGEVPEHRSDHQPAERVARRHLRARPAEILDEEVVEERQAVGGEADEREQRQEGGDRDVHATVVQRFAHHPLGGTSLD